MPHKHKISSKQSHQARALLKWNVADLVRNTNVNADRIRSFERGMCHLQKWENDEIVTAFVEHGIEFGDGTEVSLNPKFKQSSVHHIAPQQHSETQVIHITKEMLADISGDKEKKKRDEKKTT